MTAQVAILAFPETTASVVYGMHDLLCSAGRDWQIVTGQTPGPAPLRPQVVARTRHEFRIANDVAIRPDLSLEECQAPDIVCVPEVAVMPGETLDGRFDAEVAWLSRCFARGATIATACSGTLLLAETGLLDGQAATTHWAFCDLMRERYPRVTLRSQVALLTAGEGQRLVMAGGGVSWLDLTLYLIARAAGVEVAMQTARIHLIDWHHVGQQPFARLVRTRQTDDAVIADCQSWIAEHYDEPHPVAAMVRRSRLPERSFKRRFQQATGMSPLEYVHTLRLEESKHMLESTDLPIEVVAREVGYEDAGFFSRLFRRQVNLSPSRYRRRFGSMRQRLAAREND